MTRYPSCDVIPIDGPNGADFERGSVVERNIADLLQRIADPIRREGQVFCVVPRLLPFKTNFSLDAEAYWRKISLSRRNSMGKRGIG